jgi:hypothetical protein
MTEERMMIAEAVLFGDLDESNLTLEEVQELQDMVFEAIAAKTTPFATYDVIQ